MGCLCGTQPMNLSRRLDVKSSWTFMFQPHRQIEENDLSIFKGFEIVETNKRMVVLILTQEDAASIEVDPELWVKHKTSYAQIPAPGWPECGPSTLANPGLEDLFHKMAQNLK